MARYRVDIEYDGRGYAGWQRQAVEQHSVQAAIEQAIFNFTGQNVTIRGAGRTDAGVHATGQVIHFDLDKEMDADKVQGALNAHLKLAGERVAALKVERASEEFDARFSAKARHYLYVILNRRAPAALMNGNVWHVPRQLDADAMHEAAQRLLGKHDFTTFRSVQCQAASPEKTLDRLDVVRNGDLIEVYASARSFLHNQVRSMVGSLKRVGEGAWNADDLEAALKAADRARCGQVAPPDGLYLTSVDY
jgi:tRNA pseudouridine38-40 synthase